MSKIINIKVINNSIHALNDYVSDGRPSTFLNTSFDSAVTAITVFSIKGFSAGDYYAIIGEIGSGNCEIVKIHASTAPTGNTITLASGLANNHDSNEPVYFINYNQIEVSRSVTATGTKTVLATQDMDVTKNFSIYSDNTNTTGFAFIRFKNEDGTTFTGYSAPAPYANPAFNTVEYMVNEAMAETKTEFNEDLTPDFLIKQINEALRDIRRFKNKLSWTQSFNAILGQTSQGAFKFSTPSDIYDKYSFKAIERLSLGGELELIKVDPKHFFNQLMESVHFTQVTTQAVAGDITLEIDNSYDFDDSGSVTVGTQTITYTGVTRSATVGILTGVPASGTGAIASTIAVDDFVFQGETSSEPKYYTVFNTNVYIYPLPDSSWDNFNVNIDYFKTTTSVDSLDDAIDYIQYDIVKNFIKWKIRTMEKNDGVEDLNDPSYSLYKEQLNILIKKDRPLNSRYFRNAYEFTQPNDRVDINPAQKRRGSLY